MSEYFGQSPDGYQKPLYGASNLADVVDKAAARTNLGVASSDDVLKAANPIGTIISFYGNVAPYGYLPCNGQTVSSSTFPSLVTFLGGTTSATLPDLRGEFLRGWDNGRGIDASRTFGSLQLDAFQNIIGSYTANNGVQLGGSANGVFSAVNGGVQLPAGGAGTGIVNMSFDASRMARTSTETRPRNVSVLYCIKAYDTPVSAGILNVATLASDLASQMSLKVALADFAGTNQILATPGYQKIPSGLIMQWGFITTSTGGDTLVTFPTAFPSGIFSITTGVGATAGALYGATVNSQTNSGFVASVYSSANARISTSMYWMAFGR